MQDQDHKSVQAQANMAEATHAANPTPDPVTTSDNNPQQENSPPKHDNSQSEDTPSTTTDILGQLILKRKTLEEAYVSAAMEEFGMEQDLALANVQKARSSPQKAKQLQAIHEAHKAVMEYEKAANKAAEGQYPLPNMI